MTTGSKQRPVRVNRRVRRSTGRVDIVIPCYNYARYLQECVSSVLDQDVDVRVLIIDDASTDETARVGQRLAEEHPEVEFRRHAENQGHIATYNEGLLQWASSDYVLLLSADDLLTPGSLARSVAALELHPSAGLAYGYPLRFEDENPPAVPRLKDRVVLWSGSQWVERRVRECVNVVETPTALVRTRVQHRVGGYNAHLPHAGDVDMWLRIAAVSDVVYLSSAQAYYRVHTASMSQAVYRTTLADVQERLKVFSAAQGRRDEESMPRLASATDDRVARVLADEQLWILCRRYEKNSVTTEEVQETIEFARTIYPRFRSLRAYRALRRRQRLGPAVCRATHVFFATALVRRAGNELWWRRWKRYGG